ncbi:MAG: hypothetical protein PWP53_2822 [Lacrimispora sp.]|nr:hypothetical protein [Lacrimispora sp.]
MKYRKNIYLLYAISFLQGLVFYGPVALGRGTVCPGGIILCDLLFKESVRLRGCKKEVSCVHGFITVKMQETVFKFPGINCFKDGRKCWLL